MDPLKLEIYNKLNRIKPSNKVSKYPYNFWSPEKIKFTQKDIEIKFKNNDNKIKSGGVTSKVVVF